MSVLRDALLGIFPALGVVINHPSGRVGAKGEKGEKGEEGAVGPEGPPGAGGALMCGVVTKTGTISAGSNFTITVIEEGVAYKITAKEELERPCVVQATATGENRVMTSLGGVSKKEWVVIGWEMSSGTPKSSGFVFTATPTI